MCKDTVRGVDWCTMGTHMREEVMHVQSIILASSGCYTGTRWAVLPTSSLDGGSCGMVLDEKDDLNGKPR